MQKDVRLKCFACKKTEINTQILKKIDTYNKTKDNIIYCLCTLLQYDGRNLNLEQNRELVMYM